MSALGASGGAAPWRKSGFDPKRWRGTGVDGLDGARVTIGRHPTRALELVRIQHLRSAWIGDWRAGVDRGCENSARESIEPRRARIFAIYLALRGYRPRKLGARDPPQRRTASTPCPRLRFCHEQTLSANTPNLPKFRGFQVCRSGLYSKKSANQPSVRADNGFARVRCGIVIVTKSHMNAANSSVFERSTIAIVEAWRQNSKKLRKDLNVYGHLRTRTSTARGTRVEEGTNSSRRGLGRPMKDRPRSQGSGVCRRSHGD